MATQILRPSGAGGHTGLSANPATNNYTRVDEAVVDDTDYVYRGTYTYEYDLYALEDHSIPAGSTVNSVTIYYRYKVGAGGGTACEKPAIYENSTLTYGTEACGNSTSWVNGSWVKTTKPSDSGAWSLTDINNLQVGIALHGDSDYATAYCSQIYVVVDYTEEGGTNVTVTPSAQTLSITLKSPTVLIGKKVEISALSLTSSLKAPNVLIGKKVSLVSQDLNLTLKTPLTKTTLSLDKQSLQLTLNSPTIKVSDSVILDAQNLTLTLNSPLIKNSFIAPVQQLQLTLKTPTVLIDRVKILDKQELTLKLKQPSIKITLPCTYSPAPQELDLTLKSPTVLIDRNISLGLQELSLTLKDPSVLIEIISKGDAMIYPIVKKIYDEMITGVGPNSSNADDKIENVYINLPETISGNSFLSVEYGNKSSGEYQIGQNFSFHYTYNIDIIIGVKHSDKLEALELLDKLEKRVLIALTTSNVESILEEESTVTERVMCLKLTGANYQDLFKTTDLAYGIKLNLQVETQLDIS